MDFFVQSKIATPVLNTPHFSSVFGGANRDRLLLDEKGHLRALEFVALGGTFFEVVEDLKDFILRVRIPSYSPSEYFIDSRFTLPCKARKTPPLFFSQKWEESLLLSRLENLMKTPYIWGGNYSPGIPELFLYYPPSCELDAATKNHWMLKGVDCSGLLYEVAEGRVPRNTSELVHFGQPLPIEDLSAQKIASLVRPLDLIVYSGHLIIVFDSSSTIESREKLGVVKTPLEQRLQELLKNRKPQNSYPKNPSAPSFVIRRWTAL